MGRGRRGNEVGRRGVRRGNGGVGGRRWVRRGEGRGKGVLRKGVRG